MNEVKAAAPFDLVLVGYRPADTEKAIAFCNRAFGTDLVHRRVLVLNNDLLATSAKARASGWEVIQGSNVLAEFSGWQEGWAACDRARVSPGGVIFVNDSVVTHRHFTTARRLALVRSIRNASGATLVGFRDRVGGSLVVANLRVNSWASTYCFLISDQPQPRE